MTLTTERLKQLADPNMICKCSWDEYKSMATELLANRAASTARPDSAAPSAGVHCASDSAETIENNPKSWAAWKREAERLQAIIDANREAQPVGTVKSFSLGCYGELLRPMPEGTKLYTAPPAPAVDCEDCGDNPRMACGTCQSLYVSAPAVPDEYVAAMPTPTNLGYEAGWNACRAAMLAQPVSQRYTLPPHVFRELVNSLRDTAVKFSGTEQLRERLNTALSQFIDPDHPHTRLAAPEGGNDHDTRR